jgi:hypothetical protein
LTITILAALDSLRLSSAAGKGNLSKALSMLLFLQMNENNSNFFKKQDIYYKQTFKINLKIKKL